jgi:hypothetical protein
MHVLFSFRFVFPRYSLTHWRIIGLLVAGSIVGTAAAEEVAAKEAPLKVCLVSGANEPDNYRSDSTLKALAEYLRKEYKMTCEVLVANQAGTGFENIDRLLEADAAVFFVQAKRLDAHNLSVIRRFFETGKGVVALGSTSHGWENWPEFDTEVLGAKYPRDGSVNFGKAERLIFKTHPIWDGVVNPTKVGVSLTTRRNICRFEQIAPDASVILEAETSNGTMPVAWTRMQNGKRIFHVALGYPEEAESPGYRQMIRNSLFWVTSRKPPAPKAGKKSDDC